MPRPKSVIHVFKIVIWYLWLMNVIFDPYNFKEWAEVYKLSSEL